MIPERPSLGEQRRNVYWIGGASRAGKSSIAKRISAALGYRIYASDATMAQHASRATPDEQPLLTRFLSMTMDERWVTRSPEIMFKTFPWFHGECFEMILEDIRALPTEPPIIAEGLRLLPEQVKPLLDDRNRAVWLLPTAPFREAVSRDSGFDEWEFLARTTDPERALANLLLRDQLFTDFLVAETRRLDLQTISIDIGMGEGEVAAQVMSSLGL